MSKTAGHRKRKKPTEQQRRQAPDGGVYIGLLMIGAFAVLLSIPLTHGAYWRYVLLGYLIAMAWLVNLYTFMAYRGVRQPNWKNALARLPLRCVGYGTRQGKPIEAAAGQPDARLMLLVSIATSVVILVGLTLLLVR